MKVFIAALLFAAIAAVGVAVLLNTLHRPSSVAFTAGGPRAGDAGHNLDCPGRSRREALSGLPGVSRSKRPRPRPAGHALAICPMYAARQCGARSHYCRQPTSLSARISVAEPRRTQSSAVSNVDVRFQYLAAEPGAR